MHARVLIAICVLLATATVAQSRRWFAPEVSCWITQKKVPASWEDAQYRCERYGAVLASPLNTQLYNYLLSRINLYNDSTAYFIGTRAKRSDDGQEVYYVSVEGRRLNDMPMAVFDAIKQLDLEQGDCLSMDGHRIRAVSCWDHLPYICYSNETAECGLATATTKTPSTTTTTPLPTSTIPPGYTYYPATGSFYKFYDNNYITWYEANATCASEGAHVVVLNGAEEADIVGDTVMKADRQYTWIGLLDNGPGGVDDWRTIHGDPLSTVFHKWASGNPSVKAKRRSVIFDKRSKQLLDHSCDFKNFDVFFICEISQ